MQKLTMWRKSNQKGRANNLEDNTRKGWEKCGYQEKVENQVKNLIKSNIKKNWETEYMNVPNHK